MIVNLADWINSQLNDRGWSIRELGRRSRLSPSYISAVLSGKKEPGGKFMLGISQGFNVPVSEIERITESKVTPVTKKGAMLGKYKYNEDQSPEANMALALYAIANELSELGRVGSVEDVSPMQPGPIEALTMSIKDGFEDIVNLLAKPD